MTLHAEDLTPGRTFALESYPVTESEIVEYARQWDPAFIHADPERARQGPFGEVVLALTADVVLPLRAGASPAVPG